MNSKQPSVGWPGSPGKARRRRDRKRWARHFCSKRDVGALRAHSRQISECRLSGEELRSASALCKRSPRLAARSVARRPFGAGSTPVTRRPKCICAQYARCGAKLRMTAHLVTQRSGKAFGLGTSLIDLDRPAGLNPPRDLAGHGSDRSPTISKPEAAGARSRFRGFPKTNRFQITESQFNSISIINRLPFSKITRFQVTRFPVTRFRVNEQALRMPGERRQTA